MKTLNKPSSKIAFVILLSLLLQIPAFMIRSLIVERRMRKEVVQEEICSKWSKKQTLSGPYYKIPYTEEVVSSTGKLSTIEKHLYLLPDDVAIQANANVTERYRSIFKASVYRTKAKIQAHFSPSEILNSDKNKATLDWKKAELVMLYSDAKGLESIENATINNKLIHFELIENEYDVTNKTGITTTYSNEKKTPFAVEFTMVIKGSQEIEFVPCGETTSVELESNWKHPSFDGAVLPSEHTISDNGFKASWKISNFSRQFSKVRRSLGQQFFKDNFSVSFLDGIDSYQKNERMIKYAFLVFVLTFTVIFLVEFAAKIEVNFLQYILTGFSLVVFYLILLSFSEHFSFGLSYLIASIAIVIQTVLYAKTFFGKTRSIFLGILMSTIYIFLYFLLQLEDYALIVGSIAIFIVLSCVMYYSRNISLDKYRK